MCDDLTWCDKSIVTIGWKSSMYEFGRLHIEDKSFVSLMWVCYYIEAFKKRYTRATIVMFLDLTRCKSASLPPSQLPH